MKKSILVYRFEQPTHGLWYNKKAKFEPFIVNLKDSVAKDIPMDFCERYKADGKEWLSSAKSREDMHYWFSPADAKYLAKSGFALSQHEVENFQEEQYQVLFTRDSIKKSRKIGIDELWKTTESGLIVPKELDN